MAEKTAKWPAIRESWRADVALLAGLVVVLVLAGALYTNRISEPVGGYHHANEAFYSNLAKAYARNGVLAPWVAPIEANNPPMYTWLQSLGVSLGADPVISGRSISIAATLACVVLVFAIGSTVYNRRLALLAATVFAFLPGMALAGRNAQVDSLMLALQLGAVLAYVLAMRGESARLAAISGVLLALAALTKMSAVLAIPALALWRIWWPGGFGWIKERTTLVCAAAFALPALGWYGYRALTSTEFNTAQTRLVGIADLSFFTIPLARWWVLNETVWILGPLVAGLAAIGLGFAIAKRQPADRLLLAFAGVNLGFFIFFHFHSYYLLTALPWLALAAARGVRALGVKSRRATIATAAVILVLTAFLSFSMLGVKKYGAFSIPSAIRQIEAGGYNADNTAIIYDTNLSLADEIALYAPRWQAVTRDQPPPAGKTPLLLSSPEFEGPTPKILGLLDRSATYPVILGYAIKFEPMNPDFFTPGKVSVEKVAGPLWFGTVSVTFQSPYGVYRVE